MSVESDCKLCQTYSSNTSDSSKSTRKKLIQHFQTKHNIKTGDKNVLNYLLLMHSEKQDPVKPKESQIKRSLSQDFLPTGKENISPIKARKPLGERSTNTDNINQNLSRGRTRTRNSSFGVLSNPKCPGYDACIDSSFHVKVDLDDENSQMEMVATNISSPICVITKVDSAETLSSSLIEEHTNQDIIEPTETITEPDAPTADTSISSNSDSDRSFSLDSSWLSESNYEIINMRRMMTTAQHGRYICPNDECSYKCESPVLLNIHVRKNHVDLFGAPLKRQEMKIFLEPVSVGATEILDNNNEPQSSHTEEENDPIQQESEEISYEVSSYCVMLQFIDDENVELIQDVPKILISKNSAIKVEQPVPKPVKGLKRSRSRSNSVSSDSSSSVPKKKKAKIASTGNAIITVIKKENLDDSDANSEMKFNRSMDPKNTSGFVSKSDKERTIEKMRRLQSGRSNGTYVQCCVVLCAKWRYIEGCEDPSQIPDNWECKMNTNILSNACDKGESEKFVEDNEEFVDTEFAAGSMVWAKMKGYPWWPAMVDFCPDTDEYYWLEAWSKGDDVHIEAGTKPTWYHVVFFDIPQVKRAWIKVEDLVKLLDIAQPPKASASIKPGLKIKWKKILGMATECFELPRVERLEKFSFAALFDGKWGYYDENSKVEKNGKVVNVDTTLDDDFSYKNEIPKNVDTNWKPSKLLSLWNNNEITSKISMDEWTCNMCNKKFPYVENIVLGHISFHHLDLQEYLDKFTDANSVCLIRWKQKKEIGKLFMSEIESPGEVKKNPTDFVKPSNDVLLSATDKVFDGGSATNEDVLGLLSVIFPYYYDKITELKQIVQYSTGNLHLHVGLLEDIENTLLFPELAVRLKKSINYKSKKLPECSEFILITFAMLLLKKSATADQLSSLIVFLFPAILPSLKNFKMTLVEVLTEAKEIVKDEQCYFKINTIEMKNVRRMLDEYVKNPFNYKNMKESFFDSATFDPVLQHVL